MKKKMSRLVCALLVIAMVCAMVPAVFAAHDGQDHNFNGAAQHIAGTMTHTVKCGLDDCTETQTQNCTIENGVCKVCQHSYVLGNPSPVTRTVKDMGSDEATQAAAKAALPTTVNAPYGGADETVGCAVTWNDGAKNTNGSVVTWTFVGTFTAPEGGYVLAQGAGNVNATVTVKTLPAVTVSSVVTGTTNTTASVNVGTSLTLTATPALDPTGGSGTFAYKWYMCDANGNGKVKVGAAGQNETAVFTVPTTSSDAGDKYYVCGVTYTEDNLTTDEVFSNVSKVTVYSQYKLEIRSATADGATVSVGTDPVLRARLRVYDPSATGTDKYKDYTDTAVTYAWTHSKNDTNAKLSKTTDLTSGESTATLETKAADNVNGSTITITVTAKLSGNVVATASYSFNLQPANAKDINYTASTSGVVFSESDFYNAVQEETGGA